MRKFVIILILLGMLGALTACGTGRVRVGQATEIRQEEVYEPKTKVEPPQGNSERLPEAYPLLEVDLERRKEPPTPQPEPGSAE